MLKSPKIVKKNPRYYKRLAAAAAAATAPPSFASGFFFLLHLQQDTPVYPPPSSSFCCISFSTIFLGFLHLLFAASFSVSGIFLIKSMTACVKKKSP
ncbi:hypothetical protein P8452_12416 [Trifolium repens]|nr:hypothetical protein P8452_12416 [Trifolium repens]